MFLLSGVLFIVSLGFMYFSAPLLLSLFIVLETIFISLYLYFFMGVSWFSYIILMVFLSGMMVVFCYVSSLANNEYISDEYSSIFFKMVGTGAFFYIFYCNLYMNKLMWPQGGMHMLCSNTSILSQMFNGVLSVISLLGILYLLLALIVMVKNFSIKRTPLRSKL